MLIPSASFGLSLFLFLCSLSCKVKLCEIFLFLNVGIYHYEFPFQTCFFSISWVSVCCVSIFICVKVFLDFPLVSSLTHQLFRSVLYNFHIFLNIPLFFLLVDFQLVSSQIPFWWERILDELSVFLNLLPCFVAYPIICAGECSLCAEKEYVFCYSWMKRFICVC